MSRLRFGAFLAPHHPLGEHPSLLLQRDLELAAVLDKLGYDEFWVGEHHSTGWEMIASPELFLAAAGERTQRIRLGTGVVSLPYHHPFNVCQRMVQLDHMTGGRVIFGTGPGALPRTRARMASARSSCATGRTKRSACACACSRRGALHVPQRLVRAERRGAADPAAPRDDADGDRVEHQPLGHAARRQVRHRCAVDRLHVDRGPHGVADAVGRSQSRRRRSTGRRSIAPTGECSCRGISPRPATRPSKSPCSACSAGTTSTT